MKILHVLTQLPAKTGSGVYFTNLIESLNLIGVENAAIYGMEERYRSLLGVNAEKILEVQYDSEEIPFHICGMSDIMPYDSTIYSHMTEDGLDILIGAFRKRLIQMKEEFNPDIVISHHLFLITDLVREVFKDRKVVGICHGTDIRQVKQHEKFLARLKNIHDLDKVLTVTPAEHEDIVNLFGIERKKIHLVGGGYDGNIFYPDTKPKKDDIIRIMYAGKIVESKGVFALAATLPIIEKKHPNVQIHIVGKSKKEDRDRLNSLANNSDKLWIYNAENQKIMADHLRDADIFVLPSYFEALGLIAVEALACHKLVVASEIDGLKKLLGEELVSSHIIEFTKLPRLYDVDKPVAEDVDAYVERLAENINLQIGRFGENIFTEKIAREIDEISWKNIGKKIFGIIHDQPII